MLDLHCSAQFQGFFVSTPPYVLGKTYPVTSVLTMIFSGQHSAGSLLFAGQCMFASTFVICDDSVGQAWAKRY